MQVPRNIAQISLRSVSLAATTSVEVPERRETLWFAFQYEPDPV